MSLQTSMLQTSDREISGVAPLKLLPSIQPVFGVARLLLWQVRAS
jgi:hypothetical protein